MSGQKMPIFTLAYLGGVYFTIFALKASLCSGGMYPRSCEVEFFREDGMLTLGTLRGLCKPDPFARFTLVIHLAAVQSYDFETPHASTDSSSSSEPQRDFESVTGAQALYAFCLLLFFASGVPITGLMPITSA